ncbi:hypothetical protein JCM11491_002712 [Sporobolomyces phaffii]
MRSSTPPHSETGREEPAVVLPSCQELFKLVDLADPIDFARDLGPCRASNPLFTSSPVFQAQQRLSTRRQFRPESMEQSRRVSPTLRDSPALVPHIPLGAFDTLAFDLDTPRSHHADDGLTVHSGPTRSHSTPYRLLPASLQQPPPQPRVPLEYHPYSFLATTLELPSISVDSLAAESRHRHAAHSAPTPPPAPPTPSLSAPLARSSTARSSFIPITPSRVSKDKIRKRNQCPFCPKTFYRLNDLSRHICIHSGERPWSCRHCAKKFIRKDVRG